MLYVTYILCIMLLVFNILLAILVDGYHSRRRDWRSAAPPPSSPFDDVGSNGDVEGASSK